MWYLIDNTAHTTIVAVLGFLLALCVALTMAWIVVLAPATRKPIYAFGVFWKVSPAVAYGSLLLIVTPNPLIAKVITAGIISFYPLMVELIQSLDRIPERLSMQADLRNCTLLTKVRAFGWAFMLDGLTRGMLTASPLAVIGAIVADYVIGSTRPGGIGQVIMGAGAQSNSTVMLQAIACCTVVGFAAFILAKYAHDSVKSRLFLNKG
jgi:NitT/TauT family transport system permease protein